MEKKALHKTHNYYSCKIHKDVFFVASYDLVNAQIFTDIAQDLYWVPVAFTD